ncbi:hypothetical protein GFB56_09900 [Ensifer sp. T173]|uniref:Helix-turn-helix domain-containing protein n=1 Tax=Ensifer canadensis TaxID=555315 RepID=A0AAW4FIR5_9HYPH|nr:hypothetical protein [Ensifer canadensis]MBM3091129.1 hypothetical protein [Ensifer canadensis]UBI75817.1 helix-turn-helix domain-containing protein [Ensifer canadensis]
MARKNEIPTALDVAVARRALGLSAGISGGALNVGFALLEHFNRKTGQCDPSVARLSTMLGLGEATVKRATKELCDVHELFRKRSHGGMSHRASYQPNWAKMRRILADWERRMLSGGAPEKEAANGSEMIPPTDQERSLDGIKNDPRTLLKEPFGINPIPSEASGGVGFPEPDGPAQRQKPVPAERANGLWSGNARTALNSPSKVVPGGKWRIAEQAATRRWNSAMLRRGVHAYASFLEWVTTEISDQATEAEMQRRGDGERFIVDRMHAAGMVTRDG